MNILSISGDRKVLQSDTEAYRRLELQRAAVERLDVFVWPQIHSWLDVYRAAQRNSYDVITAQDPFWRGLLALLAAKIAHSRLNLQVHTDLSEQPFLRRVLANFLLRRADTVRVVSEKIRSQVERLRVKAAVHVLPVYIDISRFRRLAPAPHAGSVLLWIGRFEAEKDPMQAIHLLRSVRERGIDAKLIMLGAGTLDNKLKKIAAGLPVEFPGWRPAEEYLPHADAVVCTSLHESWGASIVEALAAGVPVIAPDVGIAKEAGAIITEKSEMANAVCAAIKERPNAELTLTLPTADDWTAKWRESLI